MQITRSQEDASCITKTQAETCWTRNEAVPGFGVSPPFCALLDGYCTLTGWFLIFFPLIFTLAADIFYTGRPRRHVIKRKDDTPNTKHQTPNVT